MNCGIGHLSIVPVKKEPSHRSEMVTQLLFGEHFEITEEANEWIKLKLATDGYEGWILRSQYCPLEAAEYDRLNQQEVCISYDLVQIIFCGNIISSIVIGSSLPDYKDQNLTIGSLKYKFEGTARFPERLKTPDTLIENAYMYLNCPYMWGGRTPFGIDCSGFTQMVFKLSGIKLKRDARQQAEQGAAVHLLEESYPGDLAFFDNEEGKIIHTGIVIGNNKIIHASGKVRIDSIDHQGIYNFESKRYSHNLRLIKRFITK